MSIMMKSASVAPAATRTSSVKVQASLRPAVRAAPKAAAPAPRANQMMVWQPVNNKSVRGGWGVKFRP
jgi:hypothetical protein